MCQIHLLVFLVIGIFRACSAQWFSTFPILSFVQSQILQNGSITMKVKGTCHICVSITSLKTEELITRHGYPCEKHKVTTADGYILTMYRIPHNSSGGPVPNSKPVLVQHGFLCSSADWVVTGPESGLGFILADNGYDVWLSNFRGNKFSQEHVFLNPDDPNDKAAYFDFSIHQLGYYDKPAEIDYILKTTGVKQIFYVGHSMGTTAFYILASTRPEYNTKVKAFFSLGTSIHLTTTQTFRIPITLLYLLRDVLPMLGVYEIFSEEDMRLGLDVWCAKDSIFALICAAVVQAIAGYDWTGYNITAQGEIFQNFPSGTSTTVAYHLGQQILPIFPFEPYVYTDLNKNIKHYKSYLPLPYLLSYVTTPTYIHICGNDAICTPADTYYSIRFLPNVKQVVNVPGCNHIDYLWGLKTKEIFINYIINIMNSLN